MRIESLTSPSVYHVEAMMFDDKKTAVIVKLSKGMRIMGYRHFHVINAMNRERERKRLK